jgi:hypothetical protein
MYEMRNRSTYKYLNEELQGQSPSRRDWNRWKDVGLEDFMAVNMGYYHSDEGGSKHR